MSLRPTGPARAIFLWTTEHVVGHGHDSIHGGHILLGVLSLEGGSAFDALTSVGVDRAAVRVGVEAILRRERSWADENPYDPAALAVLKSPLAEVARRSQRLKSLDPARLQAGLEAMLPSSQERGRAGGYACDSSGVAVLRSMLEVARGGSGRLTSAMVLLAILGAQGPELRALRDAGVSIPALAVELQSRVDDAE